MKPLPHQVPIIQRAFNILSTTNRVYLALHAGAGKTYISLALCALHAEQHNISNPNILVIAPRILHVQWRDFFDKIKHLFKLSNIHITTYESLDPSRAYEFTHIILDECHSRLGNSKTKRFRKYRTLVKAIRDKVPRIYCSATPFNKPIKLWPILLTERVFTNNQYFRYITRYCNAYRGPFGWVTDGASNISELRNILSQKFFVFSDYAQSEAELPPIIHETIILPPTNNKALMPETYNISPGNALSFIEKPTDYIPFEEYSRVRHETGMEKVDAIAQYFEQTLSPSHNTKALVFYVHRDVGTALATRLPQSCLVSSNQPPRKNFLSLDKFKEDPNTHFLVLPVLSASEGLNLAHANVIYFAEFPWNHDQLYQAIKRVHRYGQQSDHVYLTFFVKQKSIDRMVLDVLLSKQSVFEEFTQIHRKQENDHDH